MRTQQDTFALSAFRRSQQALRLRDYLSRVLVEQREAYVAQADAATAENLRAHARDTAAVIHKLFEEAL